MGKLVVVVDWPYSKIDWDFWASIFASDIRHEKNVEVLRGVATDMNCTNNMMVRTALDRGASEILSLSADQTVPPDILSRLRAHDKDIVGCLTATRQQGHHWLVFDLDKNGLGHKINPTTPFQKVDVIGPGCMLVKSKVFNSIPPPWYKTTLTRDGCGITQTSDFYFFKKVKEYGFEVYIDSTLESFHKTEIALNTETLGRKLPYLEVVKGNSYIPITSKDQDDYDSENYDESASVQYETIRMIPDSMGRGVEKKKKKKAKC